MDQEIRRSILHISNFVRPGYQLFLMVCTFSLLLFLSYYRMLQFKVLDPIPTFNKLEVMGSMQRASIDTGFYVRNFLKFDVIENEFLVDAYLWFEYDSDKFTDQDIDGFSFGKASIVFKSKPYRTTAYGRTLVGYDVQVKFPSNIDYHYFPINSHRIYLTLNNLSISADKALFNVSPATFIVSDTLFTAGWKNFSNGVHSGFKSLTLSKKDAQKKVAFPRIVFAMDFMGTSIRTLFLIFLPLLVIFFISIFTLGLDPKKYYSTILSVAAATITALVSYRFVIENLSPSVSYFMLSDHMFNLILTLNFMVFLIGSVFLQRLEKYRGFIIVLFHLVLVAAWTLILYL